MAAVGSLPMQRAGQSVREMSRAPACRRRRRRPTRPVAKSVVPQGRRAERSGGIRRAQRAYAAAGSVGRGRPPVYFLAATPDTPGLMSGGPGERSVLSLFSSEKQSVKSMASPSQAGSPGSSQGLDARRLEKLFGAAEQVSEHVYEQDIPRYISRKDPIKPSLMNST
jgi:hypothetical protein